jgi:hypothetical protein
MVHQGELGVSAAVATLIVKLQRKEEYEKTRLDEQRTEGHRK